MLVDDFVDGRADVPHSQTVAEATAQDVSVLVVEQGMECPHRRIVPTKVVTEIDGDQTVTLRLARAVTHR